MKHSDIAQLVQADIESRVKGGEVKYGERLQSFNGRRGLQDAYEEALDMALYLMQVIVEQAELRHRWQFLVNAHHVQAQHPGTVDNCQDGFCKPLVDSLKAR